MPVDFLDYSDVHRAIQWFDIDPSFDHQWVGWTSVRVYAFIPDLGSRLGDLQVTFAQIAEIANVEISKRPEVGIVKRERLTADQVKVAAGAKRTDNGNLRAIRVDKALLTLFAVNLEAERRNLTLPHTTIFLSAFNVSGLNRLFHSLPTALDKQKFREDLAREIDQADEFASELIKGNKVTLDLAIRAHAFAVKRSDAKGVINSRLDAAIQTPTHKHSTAAAAEDFLRGRLQPLPRPFCRPNRVLGSQ